MFSNSAGFYKCLDRATSQLLLEPDWDSMLQIVDCIRQNDVQPKLAVQAIRKKIATDNPHVSVYALGVLETCVKNCGTAMHQEIVTKDFLEFMKSQAQTRADPVKAKILELIQTWAHAFRNEPSYKAVEDCYHLLKMEGAQFPALKEADAMFMAEKAPEWKDGETCTRCRVQFGMMQRKHHCRNCGEVFCNKCSSKNSIIPKFGIEREVRVCDSCYEKLNKPVKKDDTELPTEYLSSPLSKQPQVPPQRTEQEIAEEEELQLALALSRSEAESKEKERERLRKNYGTGNSGGSGNQSFVDSSNPSVMPPIDTSDMDPELARYLNRNYWTKRSEDIKASTTLPSAPAASNAQNNAKSAEPVSGTGVDNALQNGEQGEAEKAQFLAALHSSLEIFVNRMRSNSQRGRPIANDSSVQSLFTVISNMHPQLLKYQQEMEDSRAYFEGLQDKLTQLRDAREALDSLREEHHEKRRREMEELERQRQIQMMQKLEVMRQKKHEYLEMQRQLALQRLQEQEREMAMRLEQQKQLTHLRQMQTYYPQMYSQQPQSMGGPQTMMQGPGVGPGMMPPQSMMGPQSMYSQGPQSAEGSPVHHVQGYGQPMPPLDGQAGGQAMYSMPHQPTGSMAPPMSGGQAFPQQMTSMPSGYQPMGQMPPQGLSTDGGQMPTTAGPYSMAPGANMGYDPNLGGGQPSMVYNTMPPAPHNMEYSSFNMQGMAQSLPQQPGGYPALNQPMPAQLPQQNAAASAQGQSYAGPPYQQTNMSNNQMGGPSLPPGQQVQPQHPMQQLPQQQSVLDAQLISFD